jgi:polyhydroxybutyrate depolymerase
MPTNEAATLPAARRRPPHRPLSAVSPALILMLGIAVVACGSGAQHQGSAAGPGVSTSSAAARGTYQLPTGTSSHVISVDGTERTFLTYLPAGLPSGAPLVVMLHGDGSSGSRAERDYHWDAEADRGHFIVAYPNGLHSSWNTGGGCCFSRADDIGFVSAMISAIESENPIDRHRVYAAGMSSGGMLAYALACQTTIFAAIAPVSATQLSPCPDPAPVSVVHIHGTADQTISYYPRPGGAIRRFGGPDIPQVNAAWRRIDHCAAPVIATSRVVTTSIASCPDGRTVELITIAGGGHQWPEAVPVPGSRPSTALNASQVIWKFFASHHS